MAKKDDNRRVTFRRIRGRIVPISIGAGIGAAAIENSRRTVLSQSGSRKVVERRSIFIPKTTISVKKKVIGPFSIRIGLAEFWMDKKKKRAFVGAIGGIDPKTNVSLLSNVSKSAKRQGAKTMYGGLISKEIAGIVSKRGGRLSLLSKKGAKLIGLAAAKGEITRLRKGIGRAVVTGILRLK